MAKNEKRGIKKENGNGRSGAASASGSWTLKSCLHSAFYLIIGKSTPSIPEFKKSLSNTQKYYSPLNEEKNLFLFGRFHKNSVKTVRKIAKSA